MAFGKNRGSSRLHGNNLDLGVLFLQICARTGNRSASTYTSNQDVHFALGCLPNFGTSSCLMNGGVGGIGELAGNKGVRNFLG